MRIGFDFDNTIIEYADLFYKEAIKYGFNKGDLQPTKSIIREYFIDINREEIFTQIQAEVYGKSIQNAIIRDDLVSMIIKLHNEGHNIFIVSHKTIYPISGKNYNLREAALSWLTRQLIFGKDKPINIENVYFESTKEEKIRRIEKLNIEIYIDDLVGILEMLDSNTIGLLYNPENKSLDWPKEKTILKWDYKKISQFIKK